MDGGQRPRRYIKQKGASARNPGYTCSRGVEEVVVKRCKQYVAKKKRGKQVSSVARIAREFRSAEPTMTRNRARLKALLLKFGPVPENLASAPLRSKIRWYKQFTTAS